MILLGMARAESGGRGGMRARVAVLALLLAWAAGSSCVTRCSPWTLGGAAARSSSPLESEVAR